MKENYKNLDASFLTDNDLSEIELETQKFLKEHDGLSYEKVYAMRYCLTVLKKIIIGKDLKIQCCLNEFSKDFGVIRVQGENFAFSDAEKFNIIKTVASNFEVYPRTDGTIMMSFAFINLSK